MAGKCPVCGLSTDEAVCPTCGTILLPDQAICPKCGKMFEGRIAICDACGAGVGRKSEAGEEEAVKVFGLVPGMDEATARRLWARGFRDFADVIKLGLPESAVRRGLHRAISRKILLAGIAPKATARIGRTECLSCHAMVLETETRCTVCGGPLGPAAEQAFIEKKLGEVQGSVASLKEDPDFNAMPDSLRSEILSEMGTMLDESSGRVPDDEFHMQIEAWRSKGFDVEPVLLLLAQHPNNFRERAVRLIRAQIRKKNEGGEYRCPLCDVVLESTAEDCGNCGARFA